MRGGVSARESRLTQMSHSCESLVNAAHEDFSAPDRCVVSISRSIEAYAYDSFRPLAPFRQHRCHVGAVVLHCMVLLESEDCGMGRRAILWMKIAHQKKFLPANLVHRD